VMDDLVCRLLASRAVWEDARGVPSDLEKEAAARIEQLEAERGTLFRKVALAQEWRDSDRQRAIDAEAKLADAAGFFGTSVKTLEDTYLQYHPDFQAGTAAIMDGKG